MQILKELQAVIGLIVAQELLCKLVLQVLLKLPVVMFNSNVGDGVLIKS